MALKTDAVDVSLFKKLSVSLLVS